LALTAGLLMGAAMRPDLIGDDRPAGPQMFEPAARATGPFAEDDAPVATYAAYRGKTPDYVIGTDWTKPVKVAVAAPQTPSAPAAEEPDYYERPALDVPERASAADDQATPAAAEATDRPAEFDSEAPPEATGDTSVAAAQG
jgi:hypothetical protein